MDNLTNAWRAGTLRGVAATTDESRKEAGPSAFPGLAGRPQMAWIQDLTAWFLPLSVVILGGI
jgi:hypothetical protein